MYPKEFTITNTIKGALNKDVCKLDVFKKRKILRQKQTDLYMLLMENNKRDKEIQTKLAEINQELIEINNEIYSLQEKFKYNYLELQIYKLNRIKGYTLEEIAEMLNYSIQRIKAVSANITKKINKYYEKTE